MITKNETKLGGAPASGDMNNDLFFDDPILRNPTLDAKPHVPIIGGR
jgi:hypothetical protein